MYIYIDIYNKRVYMHSWSRRCLCLKPIKPPLILLFVDVWSKRTSPWPHGPMAPGSQSGQLVSALKGRSSVTSLASQSENESPRLGRHWQNRGWRVPFYHWLVVWLPSIFYFPINIGFLIIPIDELIFFRGVAQPPTRSSLWELANFPLFFCHKKWYFMILLM